MKKTNFIFILLMLLINNDLIAEHHENNDSLSFYLNQAAEAEERMNASAAAKAYKHAVDLCRKEDNVAKLAESLFSYGGMLLYTGDYEEAGKAIIEVYELSHKLPDSTEYQARSLMQIGLMYFFMNDYDNALTNYTKAMELAEKIGNMMGYSIAQNNIANIYQTKNDFAKAIELYEKCLEIQDEIGDSATICNTLFNIGTCKEALNLDDEALEYYEHARLVATHINDAEIMALAMIHTAKAEYRKGNVKKAQALIRQSIETADKAGYRQVLLEIYKEGASINAADGDYEEAYRYCNEASKLSDSLFKETSASQINEFKIKHETLEKEHKISLQETEIAFNKRIQLVLMIAIVLFIIAIYLLIRFIMTQRRRNEELREINEMKSKFFSIISHDLKNPAIAQKKNLQLLVQNFDCIPSDIKYQQCQLILESSNKMIELLYNLLNWSRLETGRMTYTPTDFPLIDAIREANDVLKIQAANKNVSLIVDIPDNVVVNGDRNMIVTVIRNLTSNAIKFSNENSEVRVTAKIRDGKCVVSVSDDGVGMSRDKIASLFKLAANNSSYGTQGESGSGLGLIVSKELIDKNGGEISVESVEGKGSTISFSIKSVE